MPTDADKPDAPAQAVPLDDEMRAVLGEFLQESAENLDRVDRELVELEERPGDAELLASIFRTMHTIKGTCGFFGFANLERVSHLAENLLVRARDGELVVDEPVASALLGTVDAVRAMLDAIADTDGDAGQDHEVLVATLRALAVRGAEADAATVPTPRASQEPVAASAPEPEPEPGPVAVSDPAPRPDPARSGARDRTRPAEASIRVDVEVLDGLMDLVGELMLARNQVLESAGRLGDEGLGFAGQRLNGITTDLQTAVMRTRMQAIDGVWARLPRVVRDLAHGCGKRVAVEMTGRDTELDKGLLEAMKDPLVHLVRNVVDHGIEMPEVRVAAGKPAEGRLSLRAWHEGGQVHIEIEDDGAGIDPRRLAAKAVSSGAMSEADVAALDDAGLARLVFLPGLSTAKAVTNLSGRGVGMDVVRTNIERIDGSIDLESVPGVGTTFRIRVPLTLAIVPALVVGMGSERFAIPQLGLVELLRIEAHEREARIEDLHGSPVLRLRGRLLPLVELGAQLRTASTPEAGVTHVVVLHSEAGRFGLVVDRIHDTQEIVVKPLAEALRGAGVYAGATIMGDGRLALILDVHGLALRAGVADGRRGAPAPCAQDAPAAGDETLVLTVATADGRPVAVPLECVARLERIAPERIERAGGAELVQYRGGLLTLCDLDAATARPHRRRGTSARRPAAPGAGAARERSVVVLGRGAGQLGLCVDAILDIATATRADPDREGDSAPGSVVVGGRIAELVDVAALLARHAGKAVVPAAGADRVDRVDPALAA